MARVWFVSAPLFSHTDWGGFLKTARSLADAGHHVTWISGESIGRVVQQAGISFVAVKKTGWLWPPPPPLDLAHLTRPEANTVRYRRALDTWLSEDLVGDATAELLDLAGEIGKPDMMVSDPFLSAAAFAAEALNVPLAVCGWPALHSQNEAGLMPFQLALAEESRERIARLSRRFGVQAMNFSQGVTPSILSPHLHVSYFSQTWHQADLENLLPQTLFVGGAPDVPQDAAPEWLTDIPGEVPLALITQGTTFSGDLGFFGQAAQAAFSAGFVPVVAIGWHPMEPVQKDHLKSTLPPSTRLLNWVDFGHVLPRTGLIIHHGGMGTTHAAVVHAVPQMVVPRAADQRGQARRVAQAKVGLNLTAHDVRNGALSEGARALKDDARVQEFARHLAAEFVSLGGPKKAAQALEALVL